LNADDRNGGEQGKRGTTEDRMRNSGHDGGGLRQYPRMMMPPAAAITQRRFT